MAASGSADGFLPVVVSFAVLRATGSVGKLGLVLACQSAVALLFTLAGGIPVSTALLPEVVPRVELAAASALIGGTVSSAAIAAPAIAGVIVGSLGPGAGFVAQAGVLAIAVGCLAAARLPARRAGPASGSGLFRQLRVGWAEFARLRWLWLLTGQWTVFSLVVLAPVAVLGPVIAERYLGGPLAWGIITSSLSLGAVGGQVIAGRIKPPARPGLVLTCLVPVMTAQALALGLDAPLAVVAAAAAVSGLAMGVQAVIFTTAMQVSVSPEVLSRVASIDLLGSEGGQPVGYALAGPVSAAVGAHAFLAAGAIGMFIASAAFSLLRPLRTRIVPHEPNKDTPRGVA